jgi:transcriptional regulator with XRE-family HTH domain
MQVLTVTTIGQIMAWMLRDEKKEFSKRLHIALESSGASGGGRHRPYTQESVGKMFGVSQKGARKWLKGEGFPKTEQCIAIAKKLDVALEWLMTGKGPMRMTNPGVEAASMAEAVLDVWMMMSPEVQQEWLDFGQWLLDKRKEKKNPKEQTARARP